MIPDMHLEDESRQLPPDPRLDSTIRVVVGAVVLVGGGFFLLEFIHWLVHGGLKPFLMGVAVVGAFFFLLVLWSRFLAGGTNSLRRRPLLYGACGLLTAGAMLILHFLL